MLNKSESQSPSLQLLNDATVRAPSQRVAPCRKVGLVSVPFLPSGSREVITWPITDEIMNDGVFTYLGNNNLDSEKREQKRVSQRNL